MAKHKKIIYGSLHCLAAAVDGKNVKQTLAHPCFITGNKSFSVLFYYFDDHDNMVQVKFTNKNVKRCVNLPKGELYYGWQVEDTDSVDSKIVLVLADNDGFIWKHLLRGIQPKNDSTQEDHILMHQALMPLDVRSLKDCPIRLVTEIRFYLLFMREHKYPNRKEFRKLMRSKTTFKTISGISSVSPSDSSGLILFLFMYFWCQHQCINPGCNKFSYLKCGNCKQSYYCSKICQEKDWESHQQDCESNKGFVQVSNFVRLEFQRFLEENVKTDIVGIKSAMKRIKFKIFQQNVRNNVAITHMKGAHTSIESSFREKTYLKLLDK